jgi:hypothetical protein
MEDVRLTLLAAAIVVLAGLAVGATSIGGVLVVPALTMPGGMPVEQAIAASSFSFMFTGAASVWLARRTPPDPARPSVLLAPFIIAALAGAGFGAATLDLLPAVLMRSLVALVALASGAVALSGIRPHDGERVNHGGHVIALSLLVGCLSAWSGTGGPVLLLPILMLIRMPILPALALAQAIQLPIAAAATAVNITAGRLDLGLGLMLGALLLSGWWVGWLVARRLNTLVLRRLIGVTLIAVALGYAWQTFRAT